MNKHWILGILAFFFSGCCNTLKIKNAEVFKIYPGQQNMPSENVIRFSFTSNEPVNIGEWLELRSEEVLKLPITSIVDKSNTFRNANTLLDAGEYRIEVKSTDSSYLIKEDMVFYVSINGKYVKLKPAMKESLKMK